MIERSIAIILDHQQFGVTRDARKTAQQRIDAAISSLKNNYMANGLVQSRRQTTTAQRLLKVATRTAVTALTGFLGAGKTTLLQRILSEWEPQLRGQPNFTNG